LRLIIEDDSGRRVVVPVEREEITIGRHDSNHIRLHERNVSRRHCRLLRFGDSLVIEDLQSSNGLQVNGAPVFGRHQVAPGDRIRVGDYSISVDGISTTTSSGDDPDLEGAVVEPTQPRGVPESPEPAARQPVVSTVAAPDSVPVIARVAPGAEATKGRAPAPIPPFPVAAFRALQARGLVPATPGATGAPASDGPRDAPVSPSAAAPVAAPAADAPQPAPVLRPVTALAAPMASAEPRPSPVLQPVAPAPRQHRPSATTSKEAARLVVLTTELAGTSVPLPASSAWIGRGAGAEIVLDHRSIAERHCRIDAVGDGTYRITRADPSLALSVNGEPGDGAVLRPGDTLRIGAMLLRLVAGTPKA